MRLLLCLLTIAPLASLSSSASAQKPEYAIILHGGAFNSLPKDGQPKRDAIAASLKKVLDSGVADLKKGAEALDVVESCIRQLEDDPLFNAGKGAVFNADKKHELDASIMDGRDKSAGAIAGVKTVKNPISLARLVMTKTKHVLLTADGAEKFADEMKVDRVPNEYFSTNDAEVELKEVQAEVQREVEQRKMGTVGCVVLDKAGNLAAGTSTGGTTNKKYGRVGDSPIISAGTYADNATCGVSCTGVGEHFIRNAVAFDMSARMKYKGQSVEEAGKSIMTEVLKPNIGGLIAIDKDGNITAQYNTTGMIRAWANSKGGSDVKVGK
jgi:L-asparaginase / beta-aspartyl-peptidase